jgi:hypothetical protein
MHHLLYFSKSIDLFSSFHVINKYIVCLGDNNFGDKGALALAEAIEKNASLTYLE